MAFYLKKTKLKGRTYLSIDESFYSHQKQGTAHKCYKSLGSIETLTANGMSDPISFYQAEVDELNRQKKDSSFRKISDQSPFLFAGYFPLKSILEQLNVKKYIEFFQISNDFRFDLYSLLSALIYSRSVKPCSKFRTFHEVIPCLWESYDFSYDQLMDGLAFLGANYEKVVEIFHAQVSTSYGIDTEQTYFDCTNFYFEIDREDDFRKKGPSKENRKSPIVGLGLLLDSHQIPIGMKMYPGNESEKPVLREVIDTLKKRNLISGRTIHVADKGLNCAQNIAFSKKNGDGYLFSKSVKGLPAKEKTWVLLDQGFQEVRDSQKNILYYYKSCVDQFPYEIEHEGRKVTVLLTEKRLLTYNPDLAAKKRYEINRMVEKAKGLTVSGAKKSEFGETGKYVRFTDEKGNKASVSINRDAIDRDLKFAGYNLLVTSEVDMPDREIYNTYHNLWRIEESFKIMKSDLDARPVFAQQKDTIKGHFLVCYLTVLLERIFQYKILGDKYSASEIFRFIKGFQIIKCENKSINATTNSDFIEDLLQLTGLPLTSYFLSDTQIKSILNYRFKKIRNDGNE